MNWTSTEWLSFRAEGFVAALGANGKPRPLAGRGYPLVSVDQSQLLTTIGARRSSLIAENSIGSSSSIDGSATM